MIFENSALRCSPAIKLRCLTYEREKLIISHKICKQNVSKYFSAIKLNFLLVYDLNENLLLRLRDASLMMDISQLITSTSTLKFRTASKTDRDGVDIDEQYLQ